MLDPRQVLVLTASLLVASVATAAWPADSLVELPTPELKPCSAPAAQPQMPAHWRATYLMAPFTRGQLVLGELLRDGAADAMRVRLYGVERGALDVMVVGTQTYVIDGSGDRRSCRRIGDTGWRPLPADWLNAQAQCVGSAPVGDIVADWWKAPLGPTPAGYWAWFDRPDRAPFRMVFPFSGETLAPLSLHAMSYRVSFQAIPAGDLGDLVRTCRGAERDRHTGRARDRHAGRAALHRLLGDMERAPGPAKPEAKQLMPELDAACPDQPFTTWPRQLAVTGLVSPVDADENPYPLQVLYDWNAMSHRTRIFGGQNAPFHARDFILSADRGHTVTYADASAPTCRAVLPGALRPDWQVRAPCRCRGVIAGTTPLSPLGTTRIFACPLAAPRQAWIWQSEQGRPSAFMVTSLRGDAGRSLLAVLDYHEWRPGYSVDASAFGKPEQCTSARVEGPRASLRCTTCHSGPPPGGGRAPEQPVRGPHSQ